MKACSFDKLLPYLEQYMALSTAINIMDWDANTIAPEEASEYTAKALGILSQEQFCALINPSVKEIMGQLDEKSLSDKERAILKKLKKEFEKSESIPADEMREFGELSSRATRVWQRAKQENDFSIYAPYLKKLIAYKKKFATYAKRVRKSSMTFCLMSMKSPLG